jgi:hypothetical protein
MTLRRVRGRPVWPQRDRRAQQRQPGPIRPCQPRMSPWLLALGDSQLVAQDQDLGVFPPHLPPGQAQQRRGAGDDEEDQFQAHKPKIIARTAGCRPAHRPPGAGPERRRFPANLRRWQRFSALTGSAWHGSHRRLGPPGHRHAGRHRSDRQPLDELLARRTSPGRPAGLGDDVAWVRAPSGRDQHPDPRLPLIV